MTERYRVHGSGAGGALAFSAVFSLAVGAVVVAQTLYSIVKDHTRELAKIAKCRPSIYTKRRLR